VGGKHVAAADIQAECRNRSIMSQHRSRVGYVCA